MRLGTEAIVTPVAATDGHESSPHWPQGRDRRVAVWIGLAVVLLASALRLWGLTTPPDRYWDEGYYVLDAYAYLGGTPELGWGDEPVKINHEWRWEHPPLAKLFIAAGIGAFGFQPLGWRLPASLFGIAGVGLLYLLGLLLWRSPPLAGLAALLLATDGMHIVMSRMAMLDVFCITFVLAAFIFLLLDQREGSNRSWLRGAGLMFGAAIASKWAGLWFLAAGGLWVGIRLLRDGPRTWPHRLPHVAVSLIVLPALVYIASYSQFWAQHGPAVSDWATLQVRMERRLHYGEDEVRAAPAVVDAGNQHWSPAWTWPLMLRPVRMFEAPDREVLALGNPVLWWGFLVAGPAALIDVIRRRRSTEALVLLGYAAGYAPWFFLGRPKTMNYMLVCVPFMATAVVMGVRAFGRRGTVVVGLGVAALFAAIGFAPLWIGAPSPSWEAALRWLPGWA